MPDAPARSIRVFISSTFRDMVLDREELVARTFPAVRRLCESRGVAFSEVDLRWGVTDEQKAEGEVLPICLAEIERSRPYFIGMLGERYGWVPDDLPDEVVAGTSVTELEILRGVLDHPDDGHAFFYLRDPAFAASRPPAQRADFVDDDPVLHGRLDALKQRIRTSGLPVRDYADPVALGALVLADLTALVDRLFPEDSTPDPLARQAAAHAAHAATRFADHVERPALAAWLDEAVAGWSILVTGELGAGASALVANWARRRGVAFEHYVGTDSLAADWRALVARIVGTFAGADAAAALPDDLAGRRAALATVLAARVEPTVLVLDGVDHLDDVDGAPDLAWLPNPLPPNIRVVATAASTSTSTLDAAAARSWARLEVPPLGTDERRALATTVLARYAKALGTQHLERVVTAERTGNALYLRVVLDELRQHGDHFTLDAVLDRLLGAATVDDLLELVLERYERDYERDRPGLVADTFRALWAARRGLTEAELLELLGPGGEQGPLPHATWSPLVLAAEQGLVTRSGLLAFATDAHRQAVEDRYLPDATARAAAHADLARYFAGRPLGPRVVEELPWQQLGAGDVDGLAATLAEPDVLALAFAHAAADVRRLWTAAEAAGRTMADAFAPVVAAPAAYPVEHGWLVARLLTDGGFPVEALALNRALVERLRAEGDEERLRAGLVNLGAALWLQGDLAGAEPVFVEAVERCRAAGDTRALQAAIGNLAMVRRDRGDLAGAGPLFDEADRLNRELGDDAALAASLGDRAQLLRQQGDLDGALALFVEQERLCREAGDRVGVARALSGQATLRSDRGEFAAALELHRGHEALCRELGDLRGLAECLLSQAFDVNQLGDPAGALTTLTEAESVTRRLGDDGLLARILLSQASAVAAQGRWPDVERLGREAERSARAVGAPAQLGMALGFIGIARREQGDLAGCRAAHVEEEQVATGLGDPGQLAVAWSNLAAVDIAENRFPDALARMDRAEPVFREQRTVTSLLPLLANRGQVHAHLGDTAKAIPDLVDGGRLAVQLGNHPLGQQLLTTAVEYLYGTGRMAEAEPAWTDLATACRALGDDAGLQRAIGERALLVLGRADLDGAAALFAEQEAICRRTGDQVGLAACVGNQAILLRQRGDLAGSLACIDEQLAIGRRASGNGQAVLFATANRGEVLGLLGRRDEGIAALTEARAMAVQWNLTPMVAQLDQMLAALTAG